VKGYGILDAAVNFTLPDNFTLSLTASNITNNGRFSEGSLANLPQARRVRLTK
jgi:outer membrane receptor protein involved in Fe transport